MLFWGTNRPEGRGRAPFGAGRFLIATDKFFGSKIELCIQLCIRADFTNGAIFTDQ